MNLSRSIGIMLEVCLGALVGLFLVAFAHPASSYGMAEPAPSPSLTPGIRASASKEPSAASKEPFAAAWKYPKDTPALSLNFSPYYMPGADPDAQSPISENDMRNALEAIAPFTDTIRTFGVSGELTKLYQIAKDDFKFRIIAGCWIGPGYSEDMARGELDTLIRLGNEGLADILVVGSEGLMRSDYSAESLIGWMEYVRSALENELPVGTSDTAGELLSHPEVIKAADVALYTYYPFFEGISVENAAEELLNMHQRLLGAAGDSTMLICSETGWKHAGESVSAAVPSFENAARYLEDVYALSRKEDIEIIYFEALEEKWKDKYDDGYWHLINQELEPMSYAQAALNRIAEERGEAAP